MCSLGVPAWPMRCVVFPVLFLALCGPAPAQSVRVIDGDTLELNGAVVRIANIDAPELFSAKCAAELDLALAAKRRLAELLAAGKVTIRRGDPRDGRLVDRHGRTLALVFAGGRDVGEALISERLARRWNGRRRPWCGQ